MPTAIYALPFTTGASAADAPTDEAAMMNAVDTALAGLWVNKAADQTITSSIVMTNDAALFVPVAANSQYMVQCYLIYQAAAASLIKVGWTGPAGATMNWVTNGLSTAVTAATNGVIIKANQVIADTPAMGAAGAGVSVVAPMVGWLTTTTGGTLQFQWAQSVSGGTGTVVKAGSRLWLRKVA
jgi:hypothetical protein